ncbi:hypothetical protein N7492_002176 [Penicillium capsulatum]|uniref:RING-type domain-containing protein n=1 Tax=Penicillium capsulatum TaxID=69766 RepID=A0A9W9INK2_9EURO|nr:hypothetical protein N7492_002176 [Penicillium capsulatum]KAJ6123214.1 hypothetical protein N7512_005679 [Penicillium capsulatum]
MFSATHLSELFRLAVENLCLSPLLQFDFIAATRQQNPLDGSFTSHLKEFLVLAGKSRAPYEAISSHIASAVLMDAYPPGMHLFCPRRVFRSLYHSSCYMAHREIYSTDQLTKVQCDRIENRLYALYEYMTLGPCNAAQIHLDNIQGQGKYWNWLKSNRTCLVCVRQSPEHSLPCGHSICDTCAQIFGNPSLTWESQYIIQICPLCGASKALTIRLKPATASTRVLSIDGGGPRAIIPLENLEILQKTLGSEIQISDLIDLTVGCSSGGLISLSKFVLRMEVKTCKALFQDLAKKVLAPAQKKRLLRSWLSDSLYDVEALEDALKEHYSSTRRMFDTPQASLSSNKVAIVASEIKDGAPFIFANYNGAAPHRADPAYGRLRPDCETEPYLWQIPDVFISLGTGSGANDTASTTVSRFRNIFVDGWVPRVYRSFSSSFEGQCTWKEFLGGLDDRNRDDYFRFDVSVPGGLPRMDNTECMDGLSKLVHTKSSGERKHREAIAALLVSTFFFQLDRKPEYYSGFLQCVGTIRCRAPASHVLNWMNTFDESKKYFFKDAINLGLHLTPDDICEHCHRYSRRVRFIVRDYKENIGLCVELSGKLHCLSAFPNNMQWFVEQQGIDRVFGSPDHKAISAGGCPFCDGQDSGRPRKRKYIDI